MRVWWPAIAAAVAAAAVLAVSACAGGTGPDVPPGTFAAPVSSSITIRFVRGDQPVTLDVLSYALTVDGKPCGSDSVLSAGVEALTIEWPPAGYPTECARAGVSITFAARVSEQPNAPREVSTQFPFDGQDVTVDLQIPP